MDGVLLIKGSSALNTSLRLCLLWQGKGHKLFTVPTQTVGAGTMLCGSLILISLWMLLLLIMCFCRPNLPPSSPSWLRRAPLKSNSPWRSMSHQAWSLASLSPLSFVKLTHAHIYRLTDIGFRPRASSFGDACLSYFFQSQATATNLECAFS